MAPTSARWAAVALAAIALQPADRVAVRAINQRQHGVAFVGMSPASMGVSALRLRTGSTVSPQARYARAFAQDTAISICAVHKCLIFLQTFFLRHLAGLFERGTPSK